jgi:hypothetical protein
MRLFPQTALPHPAKIHLFLRESGFYAALTAKVQLIRRHSPEMLQLARNNCTFAFRGLRGGNALEITALLQDGDHRVVD